MRLAGERIEVLVGIDVSAKRQGELAIYQASKLVTLGEMATGLAHELNQPLTVIRLAVENIRTSLTSIERSPGYLTDKVRRIETQVLRAGEIIDNMRIFGRTPKGAPEPFDAVATVAAALSLIRKPVESGGLRLDYGAPSGAGRIPGQLTLLQQVVVNLVLNARDAIRERREQGASQDPAEDFIAVFLAVEDAPAAPEHGQPQRRVSVEAADSGGGIPAAVLPRVFEPFFTTKPAGKGTGLGLSVSFGIGTEMNGHITVANRGLVAVFRISLPQAD